MHRFWRFVLGAAIVATLWAVTFVPAGQTQTPLPPYPAPPIRIIMGEDKGFWPEQPQPALSIAPGETVRVIVEISPEIPLDRGAEVVLSLVGLRDDAIRPLWEFLRDSTPVYVLHFQPAKDVDAQDARQYVLDLPASDAVKNGSQLLVQAVLTNSPSNGQNIQRTVLIRVKTR